MTTIKRLILLVLLAATFLGGYYLGHRPGSPDIFAHAQDAYGEAGEVGGQLWDWANGRPHAGADAAPAKDQPPAPLAGWASALRGRSQDDAAPRR